jgi:DNA helicase-2/ATP-dependent DNA helicase PcrA
MRERVGDADRRSGEGMPWLGTFHRSARDPAPPCRAGRAEIQLHHPRHRRPDAADQAAAAGRRHRRQALAAAHLAGLIDGWKNRGLTPEKVPPARPASSPAARAAELYASTRSGCHAERRDFGDLLLHNLRIFQRTSRRAGATTTPLPLHPGRRVPGHQRRAVSVAAAAGAGHAATSAASATTTSRSMAGAAPRSTTSCASRRTFPAPRSSGWSATTARPPHILAAASHLIAHNKGRLGKTLCTDGEPGEKVARGVLGRRGGSPRHRRGDRAAAAQAESWLARWRSSCAPRLPDARVRGALHHAGPALSRHRRPALLRAPGNPRRAGLFPRHPSAADDLAFERIVNVPKRGLGDEVAANFAAGASDWKTPRIPNSPR